MIALRCWGGVALVGLVAVAWPSAARACGAAPTPWYTIDRQAPLGEGVLLDAVLSVEMLETASPSEASLLLPTLELSVAGANATTEVLPRERGTTNRLTFVPPKALLPLTTYHASFHTGQTLVSGGEAPAQPTSVTWEFTTGEDSSEPLTLDGKLAVSLEPGQDPVYTCGNDCGTDCVESSHVAVTKARVTLPLVTGGVPGKFFGTLTLTGENVSLERPVELTPGKAAEVLITLPQEEQPYTPCFAFEVSDDRGSSAKAKELCLDDTFPSTQGAGGEGGAGPVSPGPDTSATGGSVHTPNDLGWGDDTVEPKKSSSCSLTGAPRGSAWPIALAALLLSRRRRSRSAL
jgi:hypothetical protein